MKLNSKPKDQILTRFEQPYESSKTSGIVFPNKNLKITTGVPLFEEDQIPKFKSSNRIKLRHFIFESTVKFGLSLRIRNFQSNTLP